MFSRLPSGTAPRFGARAAMFADEIGHDFGRAIWRVIGGHRELGDQIAQFTNIAGPGDALETRQTRLL